MPNKDRGFEFVTCFRLLSRDSVTIYMCDYRRGMDWILDLLTQLGITTLSLIYTFYKSLAHAKSSQSSLQSSTELQTLK
jgi:hypothetical protein